MKLFELFATLGLQTSEFERGIKGAIKQGASFASALSDNFTAISAKAVALGNAMYDIGKAAAKTSVEAVKSIITEFADTEQLLGGVETIFKGSAQRVIDSAGEAFRTAGMSANEYMQTVTSFSSSLLQGLGGDTEAAAKVADMAIQDMSDNANKFGTNIGMIQNAYQGFARDNFTMLDNLKLGYGGTQEEMARLINDSGVLGDTIVTASTVAQVPLDKMFEAIHIIQTEMDITGTTAKEASSTIAGSFNAFTAAWKNAISGMADDKDMDKLIDDLFETGENLVTNVVNLLPRIWRNVASGVESLMEKWDFTRTLKNAYSVGGWAAVWDAATAILKRTLGEWGALALDAGSNFLSKVLTGLTGDTVTAEEIKTIISGLWTAGTTSLSEFVTSAGSLLSSIYTAITGDPATLQNISNTLGGIFSAGVSARKSTVDAFTKFFADVAEALDDPTGEKSIKDKLVDVFSAGTTAVSDILVASGTLVADVYGAITGDTVTAEEIKTFLTQIFGAASDAVANIKDVGVGVFEWFRDNGELVGSSAKSIGVGFTVLTLISGSLSSKVTILATAISLLTTDWSTFEEKYPDLVAAFEGLTGIDFDDFSASIASAQSSLSSFYNDVLVPFLNWLNENNGAMQGILFALGAALLAIGKPLLGISLMAGVIITNWDSISAAVTTAIDTVGKFFTQTIPDKWNSFVENVKKTWEDKVVTPVEDAVSQVAAFFGIDIPEGWNLADAIGEEWEKVISWIQNAIDKVEEFLGLDDENNVVEDTVREKLQNSISESRNTRFDRSPLRKQFGSWSITEEDIFNPLGYTPEEIEDAIETIKNWESGETPVVITDTDGETLLPEWDPSSFLEGLSSMLDSRFSELTTAFKNMQFSVDVNTVTDAVNAQNRRRTNAKQWT